MMQERASTISALESGAGHGREFEEDVQEPMAVAAPVAVSAMSMAARVVAPVRDSISLDAVRSSVNGIDSDDLDVPAFIRKRAEN